MVKFYRIDDKGNEKFAATALFRSKTIAFLFISDKIKKIF